MLKVSKFESISKNQIPKEVTDIIQDARTAILKDQTAKDTIIIKNSNCSKQLEIKSGLVMLLTTYYYAQCLDYEINLKNDRDERALQRFKGQLGMFNRVKGDDKMLTSITKNLIYFNRNQQVTYEFLSSYSQRQLIELLKKFSNEQIELTYIKITEQKNFVQNEEEIQYVPEIMQTIICQPYKRKTHFIICNSKIQDEPGVYMIISQVQRTKQQIKEYDRKSYIQPDIKSQIIKPPSSIISENNNLQTKLTQQIYVLIQWLAIILFIIMIYWIINTLKELKDSRYYQKTESYYTESIS